MANQYLTAVNFAAMSLQDFVFQCKHVIVETVVGQELAADFRQPRGDFNAAETRDLFIASVAAAGSKTHCTEHGRSRDRQAQDEQHDRSQFRHAPGIAAWIRLMLIARHSGSVVGVTA